MLRYLNYTQRFIRLNTPLQSLTLKSFSKFYAKSHEWIEVTNDHITLGISDHAQNELGEIVHVELPKVGDKFAKGATIGAVESVKTAADIYTPIEGQITEVNDKLGKTPKLLNSHPTSDGWLAKIKVDPKVIEEAKKGLLNETDYEKYLEEVKK
jgi:glycine cleavage system H protein